MYTEALAPRWAALLLWAALLTTGCVSLAPLPGGGGTGGAVLQGLATCGGQAMPPGWEALQKYGGTLDIRRDSLQPLLRHGSQVPVQRVRLVYEGGGLLHKDARVMNQAVDETRSKVPGVDVLFQ